MDLAIVAGGRGACRKCHADPLALVVIAAARDRTQVARIGAKVMGQHLGITLESSAGQHDGRRLKANDAVAGPDGLQAIDRAGLVLQQPARRGLVKEVCALLLRRSGQGLDNGKASADRRQPRRAGGDEIAWLEIETHAMALEPLKRGARPLGKGGDQFRVGEIQDLDDRRPVFIVARGLADEFRIKVVSGIFGKMVFEVIGDFVFAFHAHRRFGPARLAAAILDIGSLEDGNPRTGFQRRDGSR